MTSMDNIITELQNAAVDFKKEYKHEPVADLLTSAIELLQEEERDQQTIQQIMTATDQLKNKFLSWIADSDSVSFPADFDYKGKIKETAGLNH